MRYYGPAYGGIGTRSYEEHKARIIAILQADADRQKAARACRRAATLDGEPITDREAEPHRDLARRAA